jgi:hypothetical protein
MLRDGRLALWCSVPGHVRKLCEHHDHERALDRVAAAFGRTASFTQMRLGIGAGIASQDTDTLLG